MKQFVRWDDSRQHDPRLSPSLPEHELIGMRRSQPHHLYQNFKMGKKEEEDSAPLQGEEEKGDSDSDDQEEKASASEGSASDSSSSASSSSKKKKVRLGEVGCSPTCKPILP